MRTLLDQWDSFYVIVGSAAGALIGLQFVVMTLLANRPPTRAAEGGAAFATPTVVHFGSVLFLSALMRAPWPSASATAIMSGLVGLAGFVYTVIVVLRIRRLTTYDPFFEDWLFHVILPLLAYILFGVSFVISGNCETYSLFCVGAGVLILLFVGLHNAWDSVTWHVISLSKKAIEDKDRNGLEK